MPLQQATPRYWEYVLPDDPDTGVKGGTFVLRSDGFFACVCPYGGFACFWPEAGQDVRAAIVQIDYHPFAFFWSQQNTEELASFVTALFPRFVEVLKAELAEEQVERYRRDAEIEVERRAAARAAAEEADPYLLLARALRGQRAGG